MCCSLKMKNSENFPSEKNKIFTLGFVLFCYFWWEISMLRKHTRWGKQNLCMWLWRAAVEASKGRRCFKHMVAWETRNTETWHVTCVVGYVFFLDFYCRNVINEDNLQSPKWPPGGGCYPTTCSVQNRIIITLYLWNSISSHQYAATQSLFDRYKDLWEHRALFFWPGVFLHIEQSSQELSFTAMWLHKVLNAIDWI